MEDYNKKATDFLEKTGTTFKAEYLNTAKYFPTDKEKRNIYTITLTRNNRSYSFTFGQSIVNSGFIIINRNGHELKRFSIPSEKREHCIKTKNYHAYLPFPLSYSEHVQIPKTPNEYDILACLTKYDPGTFENFCSEFGYDTDSKTAEKTYNAVRDEYLNLCTLFSSLELEEMAEIQ